MIKFCYLAVNCHSFTHLGYDPENTVSYFQIVKNALEYQYCHTNETPVVKVGQWS